MHIDTIDMVGFSVNVKLLSPGTFANYTAHRQAEGADLAHLKPPHIHPSNEVLTQLTGGIEEIEVVKTKTAEKAKEIAF